MPIIVENQTVKAGVCVDSAGLSIDSKEDPSFIRSESVLVDLMQRSIGLIFESAYHHIGDLPKNVVSKDIEKMTRALLRGQGHGGRSIELRAPIHIVRKTAL
jgi:hypothetical protein